jgi:putative peptidoglycan lipid II flippase
MDGMDRTGQFYDQDEDPWEQPAGAATGFLFDQDASMELPRLDAAAITRYEQEQQARGERRIREEAELLEEQPRRLVRISSTYRPVPPPPPPPTRPPLPETRRPTPAPRPAPEPRAAPPAARPAAPPASSTGRATAILAAGTFASRLTGFVRVLAIGYVLGVGVLSDAFNYANGIPNIVYDLLLGGILSATLIPVFVEALDGKGNREGRRPRNDNHAVSAIMTAIALALLVVSAILWLAAPAVIHFYLLLSPSSTGGAEKALATRLLRWFSPQVFFLGLTVASTALLNARRRFGAAAVSPVINNVIAIAALLATKVAADSVLTAKGQSSIGLLNSFGRDGRAVFILGAGTTLGYAVQVLVQLPAQRRLGLHLRPVWDPLHPAVKRVARLSSWLIGVVLTNQASLALVMILAGKTSGGLTAYQFGYQFFQLPYALIAVSVASAIMPDLAQRWTGGQKVAFERQLITGLRVTLAALIPVALIYMAVASPFIQLAIHHGAVSKSGAQLVTKTLVYFAVGLPGFSAFFLLMRAFQAMQDARTMFVIYVLENVLTVVAAVVLDPLLGVPGLALAWVGPYMLASVYAVVRLRPRVGSLGGWLTVRALIRIVLASAVTGLVAVVVGLPLNRYGSDPMLIVRLVLQTGAAGAAYVGMARFLGIRELRPLTSRLGSLLRR